MIIHLTPAETAELRGIVSDFIARQPTTPEPIIKGIGVLLRTESDEDGDYALFELWDCPCVRAFCLSAPGWKPWTAGLWTPPPESVTAWHIAGTLRTWGRA